MSRHADRDGGLLREHARYLKLRFGGPAARAEDQREVAEGGSAEPDRHQQCLPVASVFVPAAHRLRNAGVVERLPEVLLRVLDVLPDLARKAGQRDDTLGVGRGSEVAAAGVALQRADDLELRRSGDRKRKRPCDGAGDLDGVANDGAQEVVETLRFESVRRGAQHVIDLHEARDLSIQGPIRFYLLSH